MKLEDNGEFGLIYIKALLGTNYKLSLSIVNTSILNPDPLHFFLLTFLVCFNH